MVAFKGRITRIATAHRPGFNIATNTLEGVEEFVGRTFKVWYKMENHITWLDDAPYVTVRTSSPSST